MLVTTLVTAACSMPPRWMTRPPMAFERRFVSLEYLLRAAN